MKPALQILHLRAQEQTPSTGTPLAIRKGIGQATLDKLIAAGITTEEALSAIAEGDRKAFEKAAGLNGGTITKIRL